MCRLQWKLGGALLLVVLISIGTMAFLINQNTTSQFQQYILGGNTAYVQRLVANLEQFYSQKNNWNGVQEILNVSLRTTSDKLILADMSGQIIGDSSNQLIGKSADSLGSNNGTPIQMAGQQVGTLYYELSAMGSGKGYMGGRGMMGSANPSASVPVQPLEGNFLSRINSYIWIAGSVTVVAALLLGLLLTRQITRPLRALNIGAKHISEGDLSYRVKIRSHDEIGELSQSFNDMAIKLDNSEQSRRRLVSDVAHELRTPLTIIQGTVDGIADGVFPADLKHLESIKEQTVLLTHLVNDLRELSLAESGQLKLDFQYTDIAALIQRKIDQLAMTASQKNIQIRLEAVSPLPEIKVDSRRIEQVIGNLLSNAIRHTPENGKITVSLEMVDIPAKNGKNILKISVIDTGEGIPAEHLPHIFERFYRVEGSRSRSEGGIGLGLAIVKQMVLAHGGQVGVESQPGHGSTFFVTLPYQA